MMVAELVGATAGVGMIGDGLGVAQRVSDGVEIKPFSAEYVEAHAVELAEIDASDSYWLNSQYGPWDAERFLSGYADPNLGLEVDRSLSFVLERDGKPVGYITVVTGLERFGYPAQSVLIFREGTHHDYQRQGISTQLTLAAARAIANSEYQHVFVRIKNDNPRNLENRRKLGFVDLPRQESEYTQLVIEADQLKANVEAKLAGQGDGMVGAQASGAVEITPLSVLITETDLQRAREAQDVVDGVHFELVWRFGDDSELFQLLEAERATQRNPAPRVAAVGEDSVRYIQSLIISGQITPSAQVAVIPRSSELWDALEGDDNWQLVGLDAVIEDEQVSVQAIEDRLQRQLGLPLLLDYTISDNAFKPDAQYPNISFSLSYVMRILSDVVVELRRVRTLDHALRVKKLAIDWGA